MNHKTMGTELGPVRNYNQDVKDVYYTIIIKVGVAAL